MNKTQLEYAVRRLDGVYSDKIRKLRDEHAKKVRHFDGPAAVEAIQSGKLKLNKAWIGKPVDKYTDISSLFLNFEEFTPKQGDDKIGKDVEAEYIKIKDQLYLGDAKEALALIEAFAAKKF